MQRAYITALYEMMQADCCVCSLLSDSGTEYDEMMAAEFPEQCFNFGIAEQGKVAAAAGMASCGKVPFVYTSGAFLAYRAYEFIRDDVCLQNLHVKLVGMGSGTSWRTLGPSHHTTEDIAVLRALPNLTIFSPATPLEAGACVRWAYETQGPVYIRLGMSGESEYYTAEDALVPERYPVWMPGNPDVLFVTGSILHEAIGAASFLQSQGMNITIVNVHTIKPLYTDEIWGVAARADHVFTLEEHNVIGGLGSAIAETLLEHGYSGSFRRLGLPDRFATGYGTQEEVRKQNGLDAQSIARSILKCMEGASA